MHNRVRNACSCKNIPWNDNHQILAYPSSQRYLSAIIGYTSFLATFLYVSVIPFIFQRIVYSIHCYVAAHATAGYHCIDGCLKMYMKVSPDMRLPYLSLTIQRIYYAYKLCKIMYVYLQVPRYLNGIDNYVSERKQTEKDGQECHTRSG